MTLRQLPEAKTFQRPRNYQWDAPSGILAKWSEQPLAAESDNPNTISIYDVIGHDSWTGEGFTAKRMAAALRSIGNNEVMVNINSPGGDMFEGIAIYNLLREHPAKVTVQVMGWAASAASIIAMAADEIRMGLGSFMMVHNAWGVVIGNRHDMRQAATLFDGFDNAIVDIYEARTGAERKAIETLMDAETFMGARDAVKQGFADAVDEEIAAPEADPENSDNRAIIARRQTEAALARAGFSRRDRSQMIDEMVAAQSAQRDASRQPAARDAGVNPVAVMRLIETMRS